MTPLIVTARNEERSLGATLDSLLATTAAIEPLVVLDDTTDGSAAIAAARGVRTIRSTGGKLEAQRAGVAALPGEIHVFADADIRIEPGTIEALIAALDDRAVRVAVPPKRPLAPRRRSLLAATIHRYNAKRGYFASPRAWFSGRLFAIRGWAAPSAAEVAARAGRLAPSAFYDYAAPLRVDDVYLSRAAAAHGQGAIVETGAGAAWFRAPETWRGMHRYYRRMRRELERIDALFPELPATRDPGELAFDSLADRAAYAAFRAALAACRVAYRAERFAVDQLRVPPRDPWPAIAETK